MFVRFFDISWCRAVVACAMFMTALPAWAQVTGGTGRFYPHPVPFDHQGTQVEFGDLDGDGDVDMVKAGGTVSFLLNDGTGHFTPHPLTPGPQSAHNSGVVLADVDGDRDLDAVFTGPASVWLNDGAGVMFLHPELSAPGGHDLEAGDLDNDGDIDLLVGRTIWTNAGNGHFSEGVTLPISGLQNFGAMHSALGDIDGDGDLDAATALFSSRLTRLYVNDGTGVFVPHPTMHIIGISDPYGVTFADVNGDNALDLVINNFHVIETWLNNGAGGFSLHPTTPYLPADFQNNVRASLVAVGDLDGDGRPDVVAQSVYGDHRIGAVVGMNDGTGALRPHQDRYQFSTAWGGHTKLADIDGDGDLDLFIGSPNLGHESPVATLWINESDRDDLPDHVDNCRATDNGDQSDSDNDGIGDACDTDNDNDGVLDEADACPTVAGSVNGCPAPPVITPTVTGTLGLNGWYTSDVTVNWMVSAPEAAVSSSTGCATTTTITDGAAITLTCSATNTGGSTTESVTFKRDASAPTLTVSPNKTADAESWDGADVTFVAPSAFDTMSGIASIACTPPSGATFPIGTSAVTCTATNGAGLTRSGTFNVTVVDRSEPGKMSGQGDVQAANNHNIDFVFTVFENRRGAEWGDVRIKVKDNRRRRGDEERFDARTVDDVFFSNAPDYGPGRNSKTGIDTVIFRGTGRWDGRSGYTYVVTASDRGEPGRDRDTFMIEIRAANGAVVFTGGGTISDGNVQSTRLQRPWSWWSGHRGNR